MENYTKIGKLDVNKLGQYKELLRTEDVILTYEREQHIKERHRVDYNELEDYIKNVIYYPDYILQDMLNEDTVILLKQIKEKEIRIKMIIKLSVNKLENKMNSIITFWKIRKRDYDKTIRKSRIIYQKLDKDE